MDKKLVILSLLILSILFFGCIQQKPANIEPKSQTDSFSKTVNGEFCVEDDDCVSKYCHNNKCSNEPSCETIYVDEPYYEEECETVPYTDEVCKEVDLIYNFDDPVKFPTCYKSVKNCLESILGICTKEETVCVQYNYKCEITINNMDSEDATWKLRVRIFTNGAYDKSLILMSDLDSDIDYEYYESYYSIQPYDSETFSYNLITDVSYNYDLENTYCRFSIMQEPTKTECEYVTKYREDCQTVTKYHTIEKEVCE